MMRSKVLNCLPVFFRLFPVLSFGLLLMISVGDVQNDREAYADEGKNESGKSGQMNPGSSEKQDEYDREMDQLDAEKTRRLRKIEDEYTRELGKADDEYQRDIAKEDEKAKDQAKLQKKRSDLERTFNRWRGRP